MKILFITATINPEAGGVAHAVKTLSSVLSENLFSCEILTLDPADIVYLNDENIPVHQIGPANNIWQFNASLLPWLKSNIGRFDVVILNGLWLYPSYATWLAFKTTKELFHQNKPKLLVMPHGMLDPYFQRAKNRRLKAFRNWIYWKLVEKNVVNGADALLFTSQQELLISRQTFGQYHPKMEFNLGYGIKKTPEFSVDMQIAFATLAPSIKHHPYLLYLGRIHPKKGIDILINGYVDMFADGDHANNTVPDLVIAGPGWDTKFGKRLKKLLLPFPEVQKRIHFFDMLAGDEKWGAFYGCEAFILTSYQENFGIAVVEAMACGKPVLISDQVNIYSDIEFEGAGVVAPASKNGVKLLLNKWINLSDNQKIEMGKKSVFTCQKYFDIDKIPSKLNNILNEIPTEVNLPADIALSTGSNLIS